MLQQSTRTHLELNFLERGLLGPGMMQRDKIAPSIGDTLLQIAFVSPFDCAFTQMQLYRDDDNRRFVNT